VVEADDDIGIHLDDGGEPKCGRGVLRNIWKR
jgi:hypothetical protein